MKPCAITNCPALKIPASSYCALHDAMTEDGCPDLLVGYQDRNDYDRVNLLMEIKTDAGELRDGQADFARDWQGCAVVVVRTPAEALQAIGLILNE